MRRRIYYLLLLISFSACTNQKAENISPARQKAIFDSLIRLEQKEIEAFERERLRDKMSIELKIKTDSILADLEKKRPPIQQTTALKDSILIDTLNTISPDSLKNSP